MRIQDVYRSVPHTYQSRRHRSVLRNVRRCQIRYVEIIYVWNYQIGYRRVFRFAKNSKTRIGGIADVDVLRPVPIQPIITSDIL